MAESISEVDHSDEEDNREFYMQKKIGRALTFAVVGVGAAQIISIIVWIFLVFGGTYDAEMNLDVFMVGQVIYFAMTVAVAVVLVRRYLRRCRDEFDER